MIKPEDVQVGDKFVVTSNPDGYSHSVVGDVLMYLGYDPETGEARFDNSSSMYAKPIFTAWERIQPWLGEVEPPKCSLDTNPLDRQPGGSHYKDLAIQPMEYIQKNNLGYCEGNVVKYISRYKNKNGVEDLRKAAHYLEILIAAEMENASE